MNQQMQLGKRLPPLGFGGVFSFGQTGIKNYQDKMGPYLTTDGGHPTPGGGRTIQTFFPHVIPGEECDFIPKYNEKVPEIEYPLQLLNEKDL